MKEKSLSIAPAMRDLEVGQKLTYPMSRYASVQNTLVRIRRENPDRIYATSYLTGELEVRREK